MKLKIKRNRNQQRSNEIKSNETKSEKTEGVESVTSDKQHLINNFYYLHIPGA